MNEPWPEMGARHKLPSPPFRAPQGNNLDFPRESATHTGKKSSKVAKWGLVLQPKAGGPSPRLCNVKGWPDPAALGKVTS